MASRPMICTHIPLISLLAAAMAACTCATAAERVPLTLSRLAETASAGTQALDIELHLPAESDIYLHAAKASWGDAERIEGRIIWPSSAPTNAQVLAFLKDRDGNWYQALQEAFLSAGTNAWAFSLKEPGTAWRPIGHFGAWHRRVHLAPKFVGVRIFGGEPYEGACQVEGASLLCQTNRFTTPPAFRYVRPNHAEVPCFSLFEARFELPDRHADPFDPAVIDVTATIETPDGRTNTVNGFYYQDYFRTVDAVGEMLVLQGRPEWRVRYCPTIPGRHRYTLTSRDAGGTAVWGPATFDARPADGPKFVRVSKRSPRQFELDDQTPFFPIGHNTRSPFDTRMDDQFPWRVRHPEGTLAYKRYFKDMSGAGENLAEVWMCAWSLGLEWSDVNPGYHGVGDYHLGNAWELDEVLRWARESGLRVNLVLNNHGRASTWCDEEWQDNPYNVARGGFAASAYEFFSHPMALAAQRKLLRYTVARWGWDPSIFAWELWSELNLCGDDRNSRAHFDSRVIEWHRNIGDYLRLIDVNRHLISTHISNDYTITNPELASLPQLDHCCVDAYHNSADPLQIVQLVRETAAYYQQFGKPVLITEFGGSPMAASVEHLRRELHAALWSSACSPLAGTPLFWWWQIIEEQQFYGLYASLSRFMEGVDRRDPALAPQVLSLTRGGQSLPATQVDSICLSSPDLALGWVFVRPCFGRNGMPLAEPMQDVTLNIQGLRPGTHRVEIWDTGEGRPIRIQDMRPDGGNLAVTLPPLARDLAFRIRAVPRQP